MATGSLEDVNKYFKPKHISYFTGKKVIQLSCGSSNTIGGSAHIIALTSDGLIYGWGCDRFGQIGIGKDGGKSITSPLSLKSFLNIEIKLVDCVYHQ